MGFIHKTFCEDCGQEVDDVFNHGPEVCPESPQNDAKRKAEHAEWQKEFDRVSGAWEKWQDENGDLKDAYPSVSHLPDEIAHEGPCVLVYETDYPGEMNEDTGELYRNFESEVLNSPTWGDIARQFDKAIPIVGDYHHSFLEGLNKATKETLPVQIFNFCTGS